MAATVVNVGNTATLIAAANPSRISFIMTNIGTVDVYFGPDSSIVAAQCPIIVPNGSFEEDSGGQQVYLGAYYGITSAGNSNVSYWERTR